ncbi:MAG: lysophospholipid acyltransferase family protein [bacterium]
MILGLLSGLDLCLRLLPRRAARSMGACLGRLFFACVPYERRKTLATLKTAFPSESPVWRGQVAAGVFADLGKAGADFFRMSSSKPDDWESWVAEVVGFQHLEAAVAAGRGVVAVTAHFGHWELLAAWTARHLPVAVVGRQVYDARLDAALTERRARNRVAVFGRNTAVRPILRWLKEGKVLGVLADQDTGVDSLYVDFFGRPAKTPSGPAVLAQATGADLVTAFCFPLPDGRYRLAFEGPIPIPPRSAGGAMELWPVVQEYTRRTEAAIRAQPRAWAWNHARWRSDITRPSTGWDPRFASACLERISGRERVGAASLPGRL